MAAAHWVSNPTWNRPPTRILHPDASGIDLTLTGELIVPTATITDATITNGTITNATGTAAKFTGANIGTDAKLITTLDGALRVSGGANAYLLGYGNAGYVPMNHDATSHKFATSGTDRLSIASTGIAPTTDSTLSVGVAANRFDYVRSNYAVIGLGATIGGSHNTGGTPTRGYIAGSTATDTNATRTGYLAFHGQNATRYAYIGNGEGKLTLNLENSGFLDMSMTSNTGNPMLRLSRADNSNNHLELVNTSTAAKGHLGQYVDNLYLSIGSYYNGSAWTADSASRSQARIEMNASSGSASISFMALNTNNTPASAERVRFAGDSRVYFTGPILQHPSNLTYTSHPSAGFTTYGTGSAWTDSPSAQVPSWAGLHPNLTVTLAPGNSTHLSGWWNGLHIISVLHPGVTYNQALVSVYWDGSNGGISVVNNTLPASTVPLVSTSNLGYGLQVYQVGGGGTGLAVVNRNAATTVEFTVTSIMTSR